jgi:hypothetical protein
MSAQPEPTARETRWVDPRAPVTRANVRTVAEPDPELVASIGPTASSSHLSCTRTGRTWS